jgi:hypothetical protein
MTQPPTASAAGDERAVPPVHDVVIEGEGASTGSGSRTSRVDGTARDRGARLPVSLGSDVHSIFVDKRENVVRDGTVFSITLRKT